MKRHIQEQRVFWGNRNIRAKMENSTEGLEDDVGNLSQGVEEKERKKNDNKKILKLENRSSRSKI